MILSLSGTVKLDGSMSEVMVDLTCALKALLEKGCKEEVRSIANKVRAKKTAEELFRLLFSDHI